MEAQGHGSNWKVMILGGVSWVIAGLLLVLALLFTNELMQTILEWIAAGIKDVDKARDFGESAACIIDGVALICCIITVGLAVWLDYFFRRGLEIGKLASRVIKVFIVEILVIIFLFAGRVSIEVFGF
jgi:hypothetical protein